MPPESSRPPEIGARPQAPAGPASPPADVHAEKEVAPNAWTVIGKIGPRATVWALLTYVAICLTLFVLAYVQNRDFECFPGIKLGKRDVGGQTIVAGLTPAIEDSLVIRSVIGHFADGRVASVRIIAAGDSANRLNAQLFRAARRQVHTVTVHGGSWIRHVDVAPSFKDAVKRADIDLLVVDPAGPALDALIASNQRGLEHGVGNDRLSLNTFKDAFDYYRQLAADSSSSGRLRLRYYSTYPWIRFSVFDGECATFALVPFLKPGKETRVFYTEDPWLVECLEKIFDRFQASSRSIESPDEYARLWTPRGLSPSDMAGTGP